MADLHTYLRSPDDEITIRVIPMDNMVAWVVYLTRSQDRVAAQTSIASGGLDVVDLERPRRVLDVLALVGEDVARLCTLKSVEPR